MGNAGELRLEILHISQVESTTMNAKVTKGRAVTLKHRRSATTTGPPWPR